MAETYCGKSCADCAKKEALNCPGCRVGPGRHLGGDCELAVCVRSKGHETCETCGFRQRCGTLAGRERMPDYRLRKIDAERCRKDAIARRAPVLGKWLWILFWLIIPSTIGSLMSHETMTELIPALNLPGQILGMACNLAAGLILLKLGDEEDGYHTAGVCSLIAAAANFLATVISGGSDAGWTLLITVPAAIFGMVGQYHEFMAHSEVLTGVDNELAEKWEKLWKWYLGIMLSLVGSILVILVAPVPGLLIAAAAAIGLIVVEIIRLVCLYRSAKTFRSYETRLCA